MSASFLDEILEQIRNGSIRFEDVEEQVKQENKKHDKKGNKTKQDEKETRKVKSRRIIKLLFDRCPLCGLTVSGMGVDMDVKASENTFELIQFGSNPDDTGYESYKCSHCRKFFMFVIGDKPIVVTPNFSVGPPPGGPTPGGPTGRGGVP